MTPSSPAESSSHPQTLSGTTTLAHTPREVGLRPTFVTSALSSTGSTLTPPHSRESVLASSNTAPTTVSALDDDRAPLATGQHLLDNLATLLHRLSIAEGSHTLRTLPAHSVPPPPTPTTSICPADLHATGDESLGGRVPPELPAANGMSSPVSSRLGSHSESNAPAQR